MNSNDFLKEGFVEDAHIMHQDHEVQMAREECYHAAENAIALHKLLRNISEQQGLEGWVSAKITLAGDYLKTVREYIEYELMSAASQQPMLPIIDKISQQGVAEGYDPAEQAYYDWSQILQKDGYRNPNVSGADALKLVAGDYRGPDGYVSTIRNILTYVKQNRQVLGKAVSDRKTVKDAIIDIRNEFPQEYQAASQQPMLPIAENATQDRLDENQEWDVYTVVQGNKAVLQGSITATDENAAIQAVYNDPRPYGYKSRAYAWIPFVKPKGSPLPVDLDIVYKKIMNSNLPDRTKDILTSMITGNHPGGKDSPEKYYKTGNFSPKVQQYIDKISQQGVAEGKTIASGLNDWQKKALKHDTYEKYVSHCNRYDYPHMDKRAWQRYKNAFDNMGTQGVAEGSLNELSADLLQRSAQVAKNKSNQAMDPKIHNELGGGYMNPLAKHYDSLSQKFSNKAVKVGQRDAVKKIASPAVMRKIGMTKQGVVEEVTETSASSVAGVVNPTPKNKAKVGTLFGGTYKQKKTKA